MRPMMERYGPPRFDPSMLAEMRTIVRNRAARRAAVEVYLLGFAYIDVVQRVGPLRQRIDNLNMVLAELGSGPIDLRGDDEVCREGRVR